MQIITTSYWQKPIPFRQFDWIATVDQGEPGTPYGNGCYQLEAIQDLLIELNRDEKNTDEDYEAPCPHCGGEKTITVRHSLWGSPSCPEPYEDITCPTCEGHGFLSGTPEELLTYYSELL